MAALVTVPLSSLSLSLATCVLSENLKRPVRLSEGKCFGFWCVVFCVLIKAAHYPLYHSLPTALCPLNIDHRPLPTAAPLL
jgi:hypothetical protein